MSGIFQVRLFCANQFGVSETTDAVRVKTKDIGRKFYTSRILIQIINLVISFDVCNLS